MDIFAPLCRTLVTADMFHFSLRFIFNEFNLMAVYIVDYMLTTLQWLTRFLITYLCLCMLEGHDVI